MAHLPLSESFFFAALLSLASLDLRALLYDDTALAVSVVFRAFLAILFPPQTLQYLFLIWNQIPA